MRQDIEPPGYGAPQEPRRVPRRAGLLQGQVLQQRVPESLGSENLCRGGRSPSFDEVLGGLLGQSQIAAARSVLNHALSIGVAGLDHLKPILAHPERMLSLVSERTRTTDGGIRAQGERLYANLVSALARFDASSAPKLAAAVREDGSILVEWALKDRRLSFSIEHDTSQSSWSFSKANGDMACGDLEGAPLIGVLSMFLGANPA